MSGEALIHWFIVMPVQDRHGDEIRGRTVHGSA